MGWDFQLVDYFHTIEITISPARTLARECALLRVVRIICVGANPRAGLAFVAAMHSNGINELIVCGCVRLPIAVTHQGGAKAEPVEGLLQGADGIGPLRQAEPVGRVPTETSTASKGT